MEHEQIQNEEESLRSPREMEEVWYSAVAADDTHIYNVDKAFERFRTRTKKNSARRFRIPSVWYKVAGVLLLLVVSITSYWQGGVRMESRFADMVVEAPLGSKTKLMLPDGTLVWLNAGSKIIYSQGFGVNDRHLRFEGEAYFEVTKNKELPFNVETDDLNVTVLGTKFNFRDYPEDKEAVVDLLEGKVSLENYIKKMDIRYLAPAEKMVLNKLTGEMSITATKNGQAKEWTNNVLLFDEDLLPDIAKELERSYGVTIRITDDSLKNARFYGCFNRREHTIQNILDMMTSTERLNYRIEKDTILLYQ